MHRSMQTAWLPLSLTSECTCAIIPILSANIRVLMWLRNRLSLQYCFSRCCINKYFYSCSFPSPLLHPNTHSRTHPHTHPPTHIPAPTHTHTSPTHPPTHTLTHPHTPTHTHPHTDSSRLIHVSVLMTDFTFPDNLKLLSTIRTSTNPRGNVVQLMPW